MACLVLAMIITCGEFSQKTLGQGEVQGELVFVNAWPGGGAPVFGIDGVTPLAGNAYLAQLYAGPQGSSESSLSPVSEPEPFKTGDAAGYFDGGVVQVPSVPPLQFATVQVRVWETAAGAFEAARAGAGLYGSSKLLDIELAHPMLGVPPTLRGLESFSLVPEPGTVVLVALGLAVFLLARRTTGSRSSDSSLRGPIYGGPGAGS